MNKIQTCFLFTLITGLSTLASANHPLPASVDVRSNFEFGTTYGEFLVTYPGVSDSEESGVCQEATIKLFKDGDCKPYLEYKVPGDRKADPGFFYFADMYAATGRYQAQVCLGKKCSAKTRSVTSIPELKDRKQLMCKRYKEDETTQKNKNVGSFQLEVIPVTEMTSVEVIKGTEHSEVKRLNLQGSLKSNPDYVKGYLVAAPLYYMTHYKQMFDTETKDAAGNPKEFSLEHCTRKYILTANTHLVDQKTKEVLHRFRTTLYADKRIIDTYINVNKSVPVIQAYKADIEPGTYTVWMAFCASYKDIVESTVCSQAYEDTLFVEDPVEAAAKAKAEAEKAAAEEAAAKAKTAAEKAAADKLEAEIVASLASDDDDDLSSDDTAAGDAALDTDGADQASN